MKPARYALLGHPVLHALSPVLHNRWLDRAGCSGSYVAIDVDVDALGARPGRAILDSLDRLGILGANLTVPLKQICLDEVELDALVEDIGAINTLVRYPTGWRGFNTDVQGFREAAIAAGADLKGCVVVLGAGGAARAVVAAVAPFATEVIVLNRTIGRAQAIAQTLPTVRAGGFGDFAEVAGRADLVVCAVSAAGIQTIERLDPTRLGDHVVWMDLNYWCAAPPHQAAFLRRSQRFDRGTEMLLRQGAAAFTLFTGLVPSLDVGRQVLNEHLK